MLRTSILAVSASLFLGSFAAASSIPTEPPIYIYDADLGQDGPALDGSWDHANGSDQWDGSKPGSGNPGGVVVERENLSFSERPEVLTIVDTGDPRGSGFSDPGSNRKIFFTREIPGLDFSGAGSYVVARWRMDPDPPELNLDGSISQFYTLHDQKGQISLGDGTNSISMSYQSPTELAIKIGDGSAPALIDIGSAFDLHTVIAKMADNGDSTFAVEVWVDNVLGYTNPAATLIGAAELSAPGISMGLGSTGRAGAIQVDFIGAGLVPEPGSFGLLALGLVAFAVKRRRR